MPVEIRTATVNDIAAMTALWQEHRVILAQSDARFAVAASAASSWAATVQTHLSAGDYGIFVAEDGAALAGFVTGYLRDETGVIDVLVIDAHNYYAGLARTLVQTIRAWFGQQSVTRVIACAPRYHAVEQAFWRGLGAAEWTDEAWKGSPEWMWMVLSSDRQ